MNQTQKNDVILVTITQWRYVSRKHLTRSDKFTAKVTDKAEEVKALLEVGFEYIYQKDNLIFLRKRK